MIDVTGKPNTLRVAEAKARLKLSPSTVELIKGNALPKGDALVVARIAATQAAKNTWQMIPYCHPVPIEFVGIEFEIGKDSISILTTVKTIYKTGVEMEALTAASVAALTIYDMSKMVDPSLQIESIELVSKRGGKTSYRSHRNRELKAAVVVMSDSVSAGKTKDISGQLIAEKLQNENFTLMSFSVLPDDESKLVSHLREALKGDNLDLVIITGGTGIGPRDCTPEALQKIIEKPLPGISEALRAYGQERNPFSMLSRATAGITGHTIIVSLPGSVSAAEESLKVLFPAILHSYDILKGNGHSSHVEADLNAQVH